MTIPLLKISSFRASACATAGSESLENPNNRARPLGVYDLEVSHTKAARCRTGMSRAATSPARGVTSGSKCKRTTSPLVQQRDCEARAGTKPALRREKQAASGLIFLAQASSVLQAASVLHRPMRLKSMNSD